MKLGFSLDKGNAFSREIAKKTGGKWSHAFVVLWPFGADDWLIAEDTEIGGIKFNLLSRYQTSKYECEVVDLGPVETQACWDVIDPLIGDMYGYLDLLGMAFWKLFKLKKNPFTSGLVCSQFALKVANASLAAPKFAHVDTRLVDPNTLYGAAKAAQAGE
jgi:hypothetical protein